MSSVSTRVMLAGIVVLFVPVFGITSEKESIDAIPEFVDTFLVDYCLNCHDEIEQKGEVNLDFVEIDWNDAHASTLWAKAYDMLEAGEMPPEKKTQPSAAERQSIVSWLDETLSRNDPPGGTVLRRLNRQEYENTVSDVLGIRFTAPESFPSDSEIHGFDNVGEGLVISPPLMAQYFEVATVAADLMLPPVQEVKVVPIETAQVGPRDFTLNFTTGHPVDGILRMVSSSDPLARSSVWPNRFEAKVAGLYKAKIKLSSFRPVGGHEPLVKLLAFRSTQSSFTRASSLRELASLPVDREGAQDYDVEIELERGETIVVHYDNALLNGDADEDQLKRLAADLLQVFKEDPVLGAAWQIAGYQRSDRGWSWWERIQKIKNQPGFSAEGFDPESPEVKEFVLKMARTKGNLVETMCCYRFFQGPGLDIHELSVTGPLRLLEDSEMKEQRRRTARFMGERQGRSDRAYAAVILQAFLDKAFRRPVAAEQVAKYVDMALRHADEGRRFEDGIHLAIRAAFCSPRFLYRGQDEGILDAFDLASRLSYFLTRSPPDERLLALASADSLSDPGTLAAETRRLLGSKRVGRFLESFAGQWLDLRLLPGIMPDARLLKWNDNYLEAITAETELFIAEILRENHPLETFIDPDFTYMNRHNAKLYGHPFKGGNDMERVRLERGGHYGGILGQASVMMATANGVDTQPVLRGVWLLENVLGDPVPEPPPNVPSVEPDTSGAQSIRELLERHQADENCASCHQKIDPPGFALENFDPVGRWRETYPVFEKRGDKVVTLEGMPVDAKGRLPDGTPLNDVTDLKRYLVNNVDAFSQCLTEKLMIYATGREPGYGDRKEIDGVVARAKERGNGFQDLIVELVLSESFLTK